MIFLAEYNISVSEDGTIVNAKTGRVLKPTKCRLGYYRVSVYKSNGKRTSLAVHRAVALALIENNDPVKNSVNHIDGNKANNHASNLEWLTHKENVRHAYKTGLHDEGLKIRRREARKKLVRALFNMGYKREFLSEAFGVSPTAITYLIERDYKR